MGIVTGIALALAAAGAAYSAKQQREQTKMQRRVIAAEQRQADIRNNRERRFAVRNARIARASIEAQAAGSGLIGSSSVAAATSAVTSRTNENLSFLDQMVQLGQQASSANRAAASYAGRAAIGGAVSSLGFQAAGMYGGPTPQGTG